MLKTTFCPDCGKPYDISLGECPVCARKKQEAGQTPVEAILTKRKKKRISLPKKKTSDPDMEETVRLPILPELKKEKPEPEPEQKPVKTAEPKPVVSERKPVKTVEPKPVEPEEKEGVDPRLIGAVAAAVVVLLALVFGIGWMMSGAEQADPNAGYSSQVPEDADEGDQQSGQTNQNQQQDNTNVTDQNDSQQQVTPTEPSNSQEPSAPGTTPSAPDTTTPEGGDNETQTPTEPTVPDDNETQTPTEPTVPDDNETQTPTEPSEPDNGGDTGDTGNTEDGAEGGTDHTSASATLPLEETAA